MSGTTPDLTPGASPWWTVEQVAAHWQCGVKCVYRSIATGRLRAVRINGRRDLRVHRDEADAALLRSIEPVVVEVRR
jgi:excisionase family DNA binding protein